MTIILCLIVPVNAYYYEFQYFETDRTVYEVGQTIDMVAKLIAEFSDEGWCYVSFGVVTDLGPVFEDGYYLDSSLDPQFATSSYTILPNHTYPGTDGTTAFVIFNAEIYDGYSQGTTETIEVNITRGQLSAIPLSELQIPYGTESNISLKIASIHNEDVVLQNETLSYQIEGIESSYMIKGNTSINTQGIATIPWNACTTAPGQYCFSVSTSETESFFPLTDTLALQVTPPNSSLTVKPHLDEVLCPDQDGIDIANVSFLVDHIGADGERILNSTVSWETSFSESNFTDHLNGSYSALISFPVPPGNYTVLIVARNDAYASANITRTIVVTKRTPFVSISFPDGMISGNESLLLLNITDSLLETPIPQLSFAMNISLDGQVLYQNTTSVGADGSFAIEFHIPSNTWGSADIRVLVLEDENYTTLLFSDTEDVEFTPEIFWNLDTPPIIGRNTTMSVTLLDPNGHALSGIPISLLNSSGHPIDSTSTATNGTGQLTWMPSGHLPAGSYEYTIHSSTVASQFISSASLPVQLLHHSLLSVCLGGENFGCLRGDNLTLDIHVESNWNESRNLLLRLSVTTIVTINVTIESDVAETIQIPVPPDAPPGVFQLTIDILNSTCLLSGSVITDVDISGRIMLNVDSAEAFYAENLSIGLSLLDEYGSSIEDCTIHIFIDSHLVGIVHSPNQTEEGIAVPSLFPPGIHNMTIVANGTHYQSTTQEISLTIWMKTSITLELEQNPSEPAGNQNDDIASTISSGSIISPPPILLREDTFATSPTTLSTSRESCPRLSSGTNNRSTDSAKVLTCSSGNGHKVLSLRDFIDSSSENSNMTSSTVREVQPNDTIPHSAFSGPLMIMSVRRLRFWRILSRSLSTSLRWTPGSAVFR